MVSSPPPSEATASPSPGRAAQLAPSEDVAARGPKGTTGRGVRKQPEVVESVGLTGPVMRKDWATVRSLIANNTDLEKIDLYGKELGDPGASTIAEALESNTALKELNLNGNGIGMQGAALLAAALRSNSTLTSLSLCGNNIGFEGAARLAVALAENKTLTELRLDSELPSLTPVRRTLLLAHIMSHSCPWSRAPCVVRQIPAAAIETSPVARSIRRSSIINRPPC